MEEEQEMDATERSRKECNRHDGPMVPAFRSFVDVVHPLGRGELGPLGWPSTPLTDSDSNFCPRLGLYFPPWILDI